MVKRWILYTYWEIPIVGWMNINHVYIYIYHVLTIAYMAITVGHPISVIEFWENTHPSICVSLNFWVNHTTG